VPDAERRIGAIINDMAVTQNSFSDEFRSQFGVNLTDAQQEFVDFITRTEGDPETRFAGTMWKPDKSQVPAPGSAEQHE
jgi:hypothetical protein